MKRQVSPIQSGFIALNLLKWKLIRQCIFLKKQADFVLPHLQFEFNPFEWSQVSARAHALTLSEVGDLKSSLKSKQVIIDKLNSQLEDFIKTKNEVETVMLQQFMELLNEKKRKIRDQSRLLAGAKVIKDTGASHPMYSGFLSKMIFAASAVQSARDDTRTRKAGPSRASKRKAYVKETIGTGTPEAALPELGSNSDQMEVDKTKAGGVKDDSDLGITTPEQTSDDEIEDDGLDGPSLSVPQAQEESSMMVKSSTDVAQASKEVPSQIVDIPPRRQLPFGRPSARNKPLVKKLVTAEDSETEDDDEL